MLSVLNKHRKRFIPGEKAAAMAKSYVLDWILAVTFSVVSHYIGQSDGNRRQFSIEDTSLRYTYAEKETVPAQALFTISLIVPLVTIAIVNSLTIRSWWDFHVGALGLGLSFSITAMITAIVKVTVGRPRPDIIARCIPPPNITDPEYGLVSSAICTQTNMAILRDGFRSFPSGHSSMSFAGLGFLTWYLAGKLRVFNEKGYSVKVWITLMPLLSAALVAISRTIDYRHHWSDVLVGSQLGIVVSLFSYRQYYPSFTSSHPSRPFPHRSKRRSAQPVAGDATGIELLLEDDDDPDVYDNAYELEDDEPILPLARPSMGGNLLDVSNERRGSSARFSFESSLRKTSDNSKVSVGLSGGSPPTRGADGYEFTGGYRDNFEEESGSNVGK